MHLEALAAAPVPAAVERDLLQGLALQPTTDEELRDALEKAFDYRGDVTITLRDGKRVEGYVFDRLAGPTLATSCVRIIPNSAAGPRARLTIGYSDIASLAFTGRDTAAGKSWEAWVKKYLEKKAAGEKNIELQPESLD
jgi:hypothetical protein